MRSEQTRGAFFVLAAGTLWGLIPLFVKSLQAAGLSSMQVVALRMTFTAVLLLGILLVTDRGKLRIRPRDIIYFIGTGVGSIVLFNYCYFEAIQVIGGTAVPALLLYTSPIFIMLLSAVFFHEKLTGVKLAALVLTFAGLGCITGAFTGGTALSLRGLLLGLASGFTYGLYSIFGKCVVDRYEGITITFYTFFIAAVVSVPVSGLWKNIASAARIDLICLAVCLAFFCTVLPFLLYTAGLKRIEAGKAAVLATMEPLVAAAVGIVVYHEAFTPAKTAGMLLVLAAILLLNGKSRQKKKTRK